MRCSQDNCQSVICGAILLALVAGGFMGRIRAQVVGPYLKHLDRALRGLDR
jgi:hypothetical protein